LFCKKSEDEHCNDFPSNFATAITETAISKGQSPSDRVMNKAAVGTATTLWQQNNDEELLSRYQQQHNNKRKRP